MTIQEETTIKNRKTDYFLVLILFAFCNDTILSFAKAVFNRLPFINYISELIIPVIFVLLIVLCAISGNFNKLKAQDVLLIIAFLLAITLSYIIYPENQPFYNKHNMQAAFLKAIPFFILGLNFISNKKTMRWLTYASYLSIALNIMYVFYFISTRELYQDSMSWSYWLLPHTLIAIRSIFGTEIKKKRIIALIFATAGITYALAMGTRGPIIIIAIYLCALIFIKSQKKIGTKLLFVLLMLAVIAIIYSGLYLTILKSIRELFKDIGVSTRAVDYIINGEYLSQTSGREDLYNIMLEKLSVRPLTGYGVFGEWQFLDGYAHNAWFQLCMHYGYIIGTSLVLIYIFILAKAYFTSKNTILKDMILIFACFSIVYGIFGGDYLNYYISFPLGLCLSELRKSRNDTALKTENKYAS